VSNVDRDGIPDLAVRGEKGPSNVTKSNHGYVTILSGKTLARVRTVDPSSNRLSSVNFGSSIAGGYDIDGDEVPDLVVGDMWPENDAWCFSGATGNLIRPLVNPTSSPSPCAVNCKVLYAGRVCIHSGATGVLLEEFGGDSTDHGEFFGRDWCVGVQGTADYRVFLLCDGAPAKWIGIK
jgi:hypothetical protein